MRVETDDEVYRVDSVWLGPEKATFFWRWRYSDYAVLIASFFLILTVLRDVFELNASFWLFGWSLIGAAFITKFVSRKITYDRPLSAVAVMFQAEVSGPRPRTQTTRSRPTAARVRITRSLPGSAPAPGGTNAATTQRISRRQRRKAAKAARRAHRKQPEGDRSVRS